MRYRLARLADRDLEDIWDSIAADAPSRAERFVDTLHSKFRSLARHPYLGQACEELAPALRFYPVRKYVIFYRPLEDGIEIVRVIHGARDIAALFPRREE